jgi:hypothetical protein
MHPFVMGVSKRSFFLNQSLIPVVFIEKVIRNLTLKVFGIFLQEMH